MPSLSCVVTCRWPWNRLLPTWTRLSCPRRLRSPAHHPRCRHVPSRPVIDHQHTIATLWSLSFDRLRAVHPAAVQLLGLCAYLAPEPIPLDLFTDHPEQLPAPLDHVAGDPLAFAETVGALIDYSLARRTDAGLLLHRLVQAVIRQPGPNQPQDSHPLPVVLGLLRADLPEEIMAAPQNWLRWRQLLPHVLTATAHHDDANPTAANATSWLLDRAATYQQTHGQSAIARPLLERALQLYETAYGPDHPVFAPPSDSSSPSNLPQQVKSSLSCSQSSATARPWS